MGPTLVLVNQMKLMIPVFHVEFDPLQLSFTGLLKISPCGDFGGFWWLFWRFSQKGHVMAFWNWAFFIVGYVWKCIQLKNHLEHFFPLTYSWGPGCILIIIPFKVRSMSTSMLHHKLRQLPSILQSDEKLNFHSTLIYEPPLVNQ